MALAIKIVFYRPLKHLPTIVTVNSSFGIAFMIRAIVQLIWGMDIQTYQGGIQKLLVLFETFRIAGRHIWIVSITAILVGLLHHFLMRSKTGKAMRAVAGVFLGIDNQLHTNMGWDLLLLVFTVALLGGIGTTPLVNPGY